MFKRPQTARCMVHDGIGEGGEKQIVAVCVVDASQRAKINR